MTRRPPDPYGDLPGARPFEEGLSLLRELWPAAVQSPVMQPLLLAFILILITRLSGLSSKYGEVSLMDLAQLLTTWTRRVQTQSLADQLDWVQAAREELDVKTKRLRANATTSRSLIETPRVKLALAQLQGSSKAKEKAKKGATRPRALEGWLDEFVPRPPVGRPRKGGKAT